jgi:hypothetical protein
MSQYSYLIATLALAVAGLALVYAIQTRSAGRSNERRPWFHYVLLWPLVLDADKAKRDGRFLTPREWIGWTVVGLVIALAVALT